MSNDGWESQPDCIPATGFGCGEALLDLIEKVGNAQVLMSREQYDYILEHMEQRENGVWRRKSR